MIVALFSSAHAPLAQAQPEASATCFDASDAARTLLAERRLVEARARLRACAEATCEESVRSLCGDRLAEIATRIPGVLFDVKDAAGADVTDVTLSVDGAPLERERWLGTELPLDPGPHAFVFERSNGERADLRLVLVETERNRREHVVFRSPSPVVVHADPVTEPTRPSRAWPTAGWITVAAGAVALGIGTAFGVQALSKNADAGCNDANVCADPRSRNDARSAATVSTVSIFTGAALVLGGLAMVLFAPSPAQKAR